MQIFKISLKNSESLYEKLGCDIGGIKILSKKSKIHTLYIKKLHVGAANILKQDALSIGADLAVPSGVIVAKDKYVDAILIGTTKHLEILSRKELAQPYNLKTLAKELKSFIKEHSYETKIMGVINANEDSFYKNSRFNDFEAISKIEQMIEDGASIIDLGGVSSRPGSIAVSVEEELNRVKPIIDLIYSQKLYEKAKFSLDSYEPKVLEYALSRGFSIVNDIKGLESDEVCKIASKHNAKVVIMHMQNNPLNMQNKPEYENIILDIDNFFKERIEKAIERTRKNITSSQRNNKNKGHVIEIKHNFKTEKISTDSIRWVEAMGDYVRVISNDKKYMVLSTMKAFMTKLPENEFLRIHKSFIINLKKVVNYSANKVKELLQDGLDVSFNENVYDNAIVAPLITNTTRLFYDSDETYAAYPNALGGNLYDGSAYDATTHSGVYFEELKYAIRIHLIVKAIEQEYGLVFSEDFFNETLEQ